MSGSAVIDLEDFGDQGIAFPITVFAADEARGLKSRYDAFQAEAVAPGAGVRSSSSPT
jgi:hypothetical protein